MKITSDRNRRNRARLRLEGLEARCLLSNAGGIDPGFGGGDGFFHLSLGGGYDSASSVAVQPDGKIVAVGGSGSNSALTVVRLNPDGTLDATFGAGGKVVTSSSSIEAHSARVVVEPDGKIAVAGQKLGTGIDPGTFFRITDVLVEQFLADGTPDTSFGSGGMVDLPADRYLGLGALASLPDGRLILGGSTVTTPAYDPAHGVYVSSSAPAAVRLNLDGSPDPSFGIGGLAKVPFSVNGRSVTTIDAIAIQPDGKILLGGHAITDVVYPEGAGTIENDTEGLVIRLDTDGRLDASFGGPNAGGIVAIPPDLSDPSATGFASVVGLAIQSDGKVVAAIGSSEGLFGGSAVVRLAPDGTFDPTFGQGGVATIDAALGFSGPSGGVAVRADGSIVMALGIEFVGFDGASYQFGTLVTRFNPDGSPDPTFGNPDSPGATLLTLNASSTDLPSLGLDSSGDIVLAGSISTGPGANLSEFAVARLSGKPVDGGVDPAPVFSPILETLGGGGSGPGTEPPFDPKGPVNLPSPFGGAGNTTSTPPANYDGSGRSNIATYLPSLGEFVYRPISGGPDVFVPFGIAGAGRTIPAPGDYSGTGRTEIAAYLPTLGLYAIRPIDGSSDRLIPFGLAGPGRSIPAPGDYSGTGRDDVAIYLPSLGEFAIRPSGGGPDLLIPFGMAGDGQTIPAPGDYFGTGQTDVAAYLSSIGAFAIRNPAGGPDEIIPFGLAGLGQSIPVPGDYDGSGKTELAVYLPSLGLFVYRPSSGGPDVFTAFGAAGSGSIPVPGDYDGSGKTAPALFDPTTGTFAYRPSTGADVFVTFGMAGPSQSLPTAIQPGALVAIQLATPADLAASSTDANPPTTALQPLIGLPTVRGRSTRSARNASKAHS